jgi:hypothetical protein
LFLFVCLFVYCACGRAHVENGNLKKIKVLFSAEITSGDIHHFAARVQ